VAFCVFPLIADGSKQAKHPWNHMDIASYEKLDTGDDDDTWLLQTIGKLDNLRRVDKVANAIRAGLLEGSEQEWENEGRRCCEELGIRVKRGWNVDWRRLLL
jgi:hypothetical protein